MGKADSVRQILQECAKPGTSMEDEHPQHDVPTQNATAHSSTRRRSTASNPLSQDANTLRMTFYVSLGQDEYKAAGEQKLDLEKMGAFTAEDVAKWAKAAEKIQALKEKAIAEEDYVKAEVCRNTLASVFGEHQHDHKCVPQKGLGTDVDKSELRMVMAKSLEEKDYDGASKAKQHLSQLIGGKLAMEDEELWSIAKKQLLEQKQAYVDDELYADANICKDLLAQYFETTKTTDDQRRPSPMNTGSHRHDQGGQTHGPAASVDGGKPSKGKGKRRQTGTHDEAPAAEFIGVRTRDADDAPAGQMTAAGQTKGKGKSRQTGTHDEAPVVNISHLCDIDTLRSSPLPPRVTVEGRCLSMSLLSQNVGGKGKGKDKSKDGKSKGGSFKGQGKQAGKVGASQGSDAQVAYIGSDGYIACIMWFGGAASSPWIDELWGSRLRITELIPKIGQPGVLQTTDQTRVTMLLETSSEPSVFPYHTVEASADFADWKFVQASKVGDHVSLVLRVHEVEERYTWGQGEPYLSVSGADWNGDFIGPLRLWRYTEDWMSSGNICIIRGMKVKPESAWEDGKGKYVPQADGAYTVEATFRTAVENVDDVPEITKCFKR